jgi:3'-phosphoadenosine 5'-phosphosulfate sulfotransferase (PAPS reductase)/FAD synthetase
VIRVVVPVSGGKDSQACLKLALQTYEPPQILGLFCDTGFEHPLTYSHIENMRDLYNVSIVRLSAGNVPDLVLKFGQFPTSRFRMCTDRLKLRPSKNFYKELAESQGFGFQVWLGMRSGESYDRSIRYADKVNFELYPPHDFGSVFPKYLYDLGVSFRLPVLDWNISDVFEFLAGQENPLYGLGCKRVGCFPCLASGDINKEHDFSLGEFGIKQREIVADLEKKIGKSIWVSKRSSMRNNLNQDDLFNGCSFCAI